MGRDTLARILAWAGLLAAAGAMLFLALWPYTYTGRSASGSGAGHETHASLIEENGAWVLLPLAVPVLLALAGLTASRSGSAARLTMIAVGLVLLVLCFITALTIGTFYLPAAVLLLGAGLLHRPRPAAPYAS